MEKLLIRPKEMADALGLGRTKVYELLASGVIPCVKIGKCVRVPVKGLREWLDVQQAQPYERKLMRSRQQ